MQPNARALSLPTVYRFAVQFRVLGPLEVEGHGGPVPLGGPKERAVLALLVLRHGHVVSAEALIDALWGEDPPQTAIKTLQTYIFRIRRSLAAGTRDVVVTTQGGGYLLAVCDEEIDAARFECLLAAGRHAATRSDLDRALACLDEALALWRGEPLADVAFSTVLHAEAARLSELRLGAVEQRLAIRLATGAHNELIGELRQMVSEHPMREALWESLMLALYRSGRQADALRTYQSYRGFLIEELGVEPGPSLRKLERRILDQDPQLVGHAGTGASNSGEWQAAAGRPDNAAVRKLPPALLSVASTALVGRHSECKRLKAMWSRVVEGAREVVLISGEPGIGKTALAAAIASHANGFGATVLYGRCDEEGIVPYQPFVDSLRHYVTEAPLPLLQLAASEAELGRLLPDLRRRIPELKIPVSSTSPGAGERFVLFNAVASLLTEAARHQPVLLVLDDLHWADQSTLLLLRHVLRSDAGSLLVVGTYRDTELGRTQPLSETLALLRREQAVERIPLGGLGDDEVAAIIAEMLGPRAIRAPDDLAERIAAETAGNPLFVRELVRHLAEIHDDDVGGEAGSGTVGYQAGGGTVPIPDGVHEVVGRRLARLSGDANSVLAVAAVVGVSFELDIVVGATQLDEQRVVAGLEEAVASRLVRELGVSGHLYEFSHAVVRRSLYEELSASRRVFTHRRVAAVLESLEERRRGTRVAQLAHHLAEAAQREDVERAISYCRQAGDAALDKLAYEEAARHYQRALELLNLEEPANLSRRADLLLALGDAVARVDVPASLEIIADAAAAARRAGDVHALARAAIALVGPRHALHQVRPEDDLLEEALAALPPEDSLVVRLLAARAQWLAMIAPTEVLSPLTRRAMELARRSGDPSIIAAAAIGRLFVIADADEAEERLSLANEVLRMEGICAPSVTGLALRNRAHALFEQGSYSAAWESVEEHRRLVQHFRDPVGVSLVPVLDVMRASIEGRFDDAEHLVGQSIEVIKRSLHHELAVGMSIASLLPIRWLQGRLADYREAMRHSHRLVPQMLATWTGLATVTAASGQIDEANSLLAEAVPDRYSDIPHNREWSCVVFHLALIQPFLHDADRAAEIYTLLEPYRSWDWVLMGRYYQGHFAHQLGILAGILGDLDVAVDDLNLARERYQQLGAPPWLARAEQALGETLLRRSRVGDRQSATHLLLSACATATRLGMSLAAGSATKRR